MKHVSFYFVCKGSKLKPVTSAETHLCYFNSHAANNSSPRNYMLKAMVRITAFNFTHLCHSGHVADR